MKSKKQKIYKVKFVNYKVNLNLLKNNEFDYSKSISRLIKKLLNLHIKFDNNMKNKFNILMKKLQIRKKNLQIFEFNEIMKLFCLKIKFQY